MLSEQFFVKKVRRRLLEMRHCRAHSSIVICEGALAFYKGLPARLVYIAPAAAVRCTWHLHLLITQIILTLLSSMKSLGVVCVLRTISNAFSCTQGKGCFSTLVCCSCTALFIMFMVCSAVHLHRGSACCRRRCTRSWNWTENSIRRH